MNDHYLVGLIIAAIVIPVEMSGSAQAADIRGPFDYGEAIRSAKMRQGMTENAVLGMCKMNWDFAAEPRKRVFEALREKKYLSRPGNVFAEIGDSAGLAYDYVIAAGANEDPQVDSSGVWTVGRLSPEVATSDELASMRGDASWTGDDGTCVFVTIVLPDGKLKQVAFYGGGRATGATKRLLGALWESRSSFLDKRFGKRCRKSGECLAGQECVPHNRFADYTGMSTCETPCSTSSGSPACPANTVCRTYDGVGPESSAGGICRPPAKP
jgi:hypothetical protein